MKLKQKPQDFNVNELVNKEFGEKGAYSIFWMEKKNYNTEDAVHRIAEGLDKDRKHFGYAGTKDRNAITKQVISIKNVNKDRLKDLQFKDIEIEFLGRSSDPISLGDHKGNRFNITVRDLSEDVSINEEKKFLNLFGQQRFSTHNVEIGKAIVNGEYEKASDIILENDDYYRDNVQSVLDDHPNDYVNALQTIPKKILQLYVHAYQSKIWNETVKEYKDRNPETDQKQIPIVGFGTRIQDGDIKEITDAILEREDIDKRSFIIREIPHLSAEGTQRNLYIDPDDLEVRDLEEDELNKETYKIEISFSLGKGSYATQLIKQLID